jgi:hypothetical protein
METESCPSEGRILMTRLAQFRPDLLGSGNTIRPGRIDPRDYERRLPKVMAAVFMLLLSAALWALILFLIGVI